MGLLGDIYSAIDTKKRQVKGLLDDFGGTVDMGVRRFREDQQNLQNLFANAYPMAGDKTVLNSPQQIAQFQREAADKAGEMGLAGTIGKRANVEFASVSDRPEKWAYKQQNTDLTKFEKLGTNKGFDIYHKPANTTTRAGYNPDNEGYGTIVAVNKNGQVVGDTFYGPWNGDRSANALEGAVEVHPGFRRQGIASAMYDKIEALTGLKMKSAPTHTPLAEAFWESRNSQPTGGLLQ